MYEAIDQIQQKAYQSNCLGAQKEQLRVPDISREAERVELLLEQLAQVANQLAVRLTPVLRSSVPTGNNTQGLRDGTSVPLAARISEMANRLEGDLEVLMDVINRLEV